MEKAEEKYYLVKMVETASKTVKVKAKSLEEAQEKVENAWHNCEVIIEPEDFDEIDFFAREYNEDDPWENLDCYEEVI